MRLYLIFRFTFFFITKQFFQRERSLFFTLSSHLIIHAIIGIYIDQLFYLFIICVIYIRQRPNL